MSERSIVWLAMAALVIAGMVMFDSGASGYHSSGYYYQGGGW